MQFFNKNSFNPPITTKEFNEFLDKVAFKLGYVVHDTRTKTYDIIGTYQQCEELIQSIKDTDASMKQIGIDNDYGDYLEILPIQGIHRSTIRSLTRDHCHFKILEHHNTINFNNGE
jgi:hypothetical protein